MGKWEAREATDGSGWDVSKDTGNGIVAIVNFDQDEVFIMDESQATRYARALNIVDAGVDLGEAVRLVKLMDSIISRCEVYGTAHTYATEIKSYLTRIANAVEGSK